MKKVFMIGLGILLLSGGFIFSSEAGQRISNSVCGCNVVTNTVDRKKRYKSRGCCADRTRAIRAFSDRIGPWRYKARRNRCKSCSQQAYSNRYLPRGDAHLYSQYRKSNLSGRQRLALQRQIFARDGGGVRVLNTLPRELSDRHVVRRGDYNLKRDGYDLKNNALAQPYASPKNIAMKSIAGFTADENGVYRKNGTSAAFRVVSGGKCNVIAFGSCAKKLEDTFRKTSYIDSVSGENSQVRWNQTVHTDFNYFQSLVTNYEGYSRGKLNSYFTYSVINPATGEIIRIEGVSAVQDKHQAAEVFHEVFESFRFVPVV